MSLVVNCGTGIVDDADVLVDELGGDLSSDFARDLGCDHSDLAISS